MIFDKETILEVVKKHQAVEPWVFQARKNNDELQALITGKGFNNYLIEHIEYVESKKRAIARKKYAKDIRDLFARLFQKRENVFQATGGSEDLQIKSDAVKETFSKFINNIKGNKSLQGYLSENYFQQMDIDPNGLIFLEYKSENNEITKIYPTYKSIKDIRYYKANGQKIEYVVFEPKVTNLTDKTTVTTIRIVDEKTDWTIRIIAGLPVVDIDKTFEHPFGDVPALVLSNKEVVGEQIRLSSIDSISELSKDFARDKSILTIYKFQNGFPIHWRYVTQCRNCTGTRKTGDGKPCKVCDAKGYLEKPDVTDVINITKPKQDDPVITPEIAGFIQPDLETWKQYKLDLQDFEQIMEQTIWGTHEVKGANETATGRFIDVQPITNELNRYTDVVEWVHNCLANWILNALDPTKNKEEIAYHKSYGRRFIIESPDVILKRYEEAKTNNDNSVILDKLLEEFVLSKYKSDVVMQLRMVKKIHLEPFVHYNIDQINSIFGVEKAKEKMLFNEFWKQADTSLSEDELSKQFKLYINEQSNGSSN